MLDILTLAAARKYTDVSSADLRKLIEESSFLQYKGTKEYITDLPLSGNRGDVWHVNEDGGEYAWNGTTWEDLGKGIDLSAYYTKTETDTLVSGKADAFTAGNGLTFVNNVLKALTNAQFVDTLPSTNINEEATYYIMDSKVFPDVSGYDTTGSYPVKFVAYNEDDSKWYLMRYEGESLFHWYYHNVQDKTYEIYTLNATQDGWTLVESGTNSNWANYFDVGKNEGDKLISQIWYANTTVYVYGDGKVYNIANNKANKYGVPTDTSQLNPYVQIGYQRKNNEWINLGRSDFTKLFEVLVTTVNGKQDTLVNQTNIKSINGQSLLGSGDLSVPVPTVEQSTGQSTSNVMSQKATTDALSGKLNNPLIFTNVSVSSWSDNTTTPDSGYEEYDYKAEIQNLSGITSAMVATVIFAEEEAKSGNYSINCETGTDSVIIYGNTDDSIVIPTIIAGTPIAVATGDAAHNYSTNEQVVGTWIDGKPVYEKTISFTLDEEVNNHLIPLSDIDAMISCNGSIKLGASGSNNWFHSPFSASNLNAKIEWTTTDTVTGIGVKFSSGWKLTAGYAVIQYTKTTDTATNS